MEMTTTKTVVVFAIIFGCFAVLYPKIFHPMVLHIFGMGQAKRANDDILNKVPPHLRKGPGPARILQEEITRHSRPGPHPGLRAAAEMKKQAATTTGTGKGMMGVVLPMYAVGIVIYLIYTLTKVFGKKEEKKEDALSNNPFSDIRYDPNKKEFKYSDGQDDSEDEKDLSKSKQQQRDLERLLLRADERNIRYKQLCDQILEQSVTAVATEERPRYDSHFTLLPPFRIYSPKKKAELEMHQLKARLLETEAQMSRILKAMEGVSEKVIPRENPEAAEQPEAAEKPTTPSAERPAAQTPTDTTRIPRTVDSSPDMESYEIIDGMSSSAQTPVEDLGPVSEEHVDKKSSDKEEEVQPQDEAVESADKDKADVAEKAAIDRDETSAMPSEQAAESEQTVETKEAPECKPEEESDTSSAPTKGDELSQAELAATATEELIPEKKEDPVQEPRPDLRKRKQGKKARRDN